MAVNFLGKRNPSRSEADLEPGDDGLMVRSFTHFTLVRMLRRPTEAKVLV